MRSRRLTGLICLFVLSGLILFTGCNAFSAERQHRRSYAIQTDLDNIVDDVDYLLGLQEPGTMHEETFPPFKSERLAR